MKRKRAIIAALIVAAFCFTASASIPAYAVKPTEEAYCNIGKDHFLGLRAWYDGLEREGDTCTIKSPSGDAEVRKYVWTIILNVVSMILGVVGYLAIGLVMYGGIQFMLGQGDPNKIAKGKKTITNSVIGLAIVMSASIISGAISDIISGFDDPDNPEQNGATFFQSIFNKVILWSGIIAAIMIVYGGIQYITSTGNPSAVTKAKTTIIYSVVGLLVVLTAAIIVNTLVGAMAKGGGL